MNYLNHNSVLTCEHGGRIIFSAPAMPKHLINGSPILTERDFMNSTIVGCVRSPHEIPCTRISSIFYGRAKNYLAGGQIPLLDSLRAITNGQPPVLCKLLSNEGSNMAVLQVERPGRAPEPPPAGKWNIKNLRWSCGEARSGDKVALMAETPGLADGTEAKIIIRDYDADGSHDAVKSFFCEVRDAAIKFDWDYEYHEDVDDIKTKEEVERYKGKYNPPEYYFEIEALGRVFGSNQESGLLEFKDWLEIHIVDDLTGQPFANEEFVVKFADGSEQKGRLDRNGFVRIGKAPPGKIEIIFAKIP